MTAPRDSDRSGEADETRRGSTVGESAVAEGQSPNPGRHTGTPKTGSEDERPKRTFDQAGDPPDLRTIALQWYTGFDWGAPHTVRESNFAVEGFKDGYRAATLTPPPTAGEPDTWFPMSAVLDDTAGERNVLAKTVPHDVVTHRSAWRQAILLARDFASEGSEDPEADRSYWNHELRAFDRTFADLTATAIRNIDHAESDHD